MTPCGQVTGHPFRGPCYVRLQPRGLVASLKCLGEFPNKALSVSWSPHELFQVCKIEHSRKPEPLVWAAPTPPRSSEGPPPHPALGIHLPIPCRPAHPVRGGPALGRCPGLGSGGCWPGRRHGGVAGRSPAWPAAPGTCCPCVFVQWVRRGSRILSVGPWVTWASGPSCWGWQLLRGAVLWPLCPSLSQLPDKQVRVSRSLR